MGVNRVTNNLLLMSLAVVLAGCAVEPVEPAVVVEPVVLAVCDPITPIAPCVDQGFGYYYAPPTVGMVGWYPMAPVGYVAPVGINVSVGFGGGTVVNNTVINNTAVNNINHGAPPMVPTAAPPAVPHPSFMQAHPGFANALHTVGHAAAVGAQAAVKTAAVVGKAGVGKAGGAAPAVKTPIK
jgi:hypothetical protein